MNPLIQVRATGQAPGTYMETKDELFLAYDYLVMNPGHYLIFSESHGTTLNYDKKLEMVYQYAKEGKFFTTLNYLDRKYCDSALLGWESGDKIGYGGGYPSRNEYNYWFLLWLPKSFKDGDIWKHNNAGYLVSYVGEKTVNGMVFSDCIKLSINNLEGIREYSRGEGEVYLAKNVGIIEWEFRKPDGVIFNLKIEEYGELQPVTVSGRLTLDGRYPAVNYHVGLSNRAEADLSNTVTDEDGRFSLQAFGHKIVLRCARITTDGSLDFDDHIEHEIWNVEEDITNYEISMGYPPLPDKIDIDEIVISDDRCNVGDPQQINIHASWAWDHSDAADIIISIDGTDYITNKTGWISFTAKSNSIGKKEWVITGVSDCDSFDFKISTPSIIWDQVELVFNNIRIDVSSDFIQWSGRYMYNNETFEGSFILNDTIAKPTVGKYAYRVMGISDPKYDLTSFDANDFTVIFDRVHLNLSLADDRIDVGEEPELFVSGVYEYDSQPFLGQVSLNHPSSMDEVGDFTYSVQSITDPLYGLTAFTCNNVTCIWDRVKIVDGGVSSEVAKPGEIVTVWFKVMYEYDSEVFDGSKGVLYVNGEPMEWSSNNQRWEKEYVSEQPEAITLSVTGIKDEKYGLTVYNDAVGPLSVEWKKPGIPGFPYESIMLGLVLGAFMFWVVQQRK